MNPHKILHSGDLELIAANLGKEEILEHFGEESFEYLAYEQMLAGQMSRRSLKIPRRTEDPSATYGMLKCWIREFCSQNEKPLPKGFHQRNKRQLLGMYHGMLEYYQIKATDIVPEYAPR